MQPLSSIQRRHICDVVALAEGSLVVDQPLQVVQVRIVGRLGRRLIMVHKGGQIQPPHRKANFGVNLQLTQRIEPFEMQDEDTRGGREGKPFFGRSGYFARLAIDLLGEGLEGGEVFETLDETDGFLGS